MSGGGGGDGPGAPLWIISFADMISNLVIFFILVATYASKNTETNSVPRKVLHREVGVFGNAKDRQQSAVVGLSGSTARPGEVAPEARSRREGTESDTLSTRIQDKSFVVKPKISDLEDGVRVTLEERGVFVAGSDQLSADGAEIVAEIGRFYREENVDFLVEAHTDDRSFRISPHGSEVDLTKAMGIAVAVVLARDADIDPPRIGVSPFGAERPIDSNLNATGRARNRRIEIVIREQP